jgi:hypothetical protein
MGPNTKLWLVGPHGTQTPMELEDKIPIMASFKGGESSTDPRRCTAHSRQTGKRCKNASIPGGRVCRYHGGAAPQVQEANERLRELEYPAVEAIARMLEPPSPKNLYAAALRGGTVLNAAKTVLDRTEKLEAGRGPGKTLVDVSRLSTPLLELLQAELRQIAERDSKTKSSPPVPGPSDEQPSERS